ncbi:hypothetical protein OJF2_39090 [Aquisphaera giovannonii]|uniref:Uncharacterized protein n=1 Tax=Aquisphaera giovannonii TaxID=406548 RepID=A0A5B9W446_9BACT|nr:hypothetical protein [Aquisphaera giovannonii]QEH35358.1 hypothetical protein OJF2_39090 [Aquisphaera giovannonii]
MVRRRLPFAVSLGLAFTLAAALTTPAARAQDAKKETPKAEAKPAEPAKPADAKPADAKPAEPAKKDEAKPAEPKKEEAKPAEVPPPVVPKAVEEKLEAARHAVAEAIVAAQDAGLVESSLDPPPVLDILIKGYAIDARTLKNPAAKKDGVWAVTPEVFCGWFTGYGKLDGTSINPQDEIRIVNPSAGLKEWYDQRANILNRHIEMVRKAKGPAPAAAAKPAEPKKDEAKPAEPKKDEAKPAEPKKDEPKPAEPKKDEPKKS